MIPLEKSADANNNAFYVRCESIQQSKNYAVCLHLLSLTDRAIAGQVGLETEMYGACHKAIRAANCPARQMLHEEKLKGEAIYFIQRGTGTKTYDPPSGSIRSGDGGAPVSNSKTAFAKAAKPSAPKAQSKPVKASEGLITGAADQYSESINSAIEREIAKETAKPAVSMAERARLARERLKATN